MAEISRRDSGTGGTSDACLRYVTSSITIHAGNGNVREGGSCYLQPCAGNAKVRSVVGSHGGGWNMSVTSRRLRHEQRQRIHTGRLTPQLVNKQEMVYNSNGHATARLMNTKAT